MEGDDSDPLPANFGGTPQLGWGTTNRDQPREAFLNLAEHHYRRVIQMLMLLGADQEDAKDAAQDAFLQGWDRVSDSRWAAVVKPDAWIRKVALRCYQRPPGRARTQPLIAQGVELPDIAEFGPGHAELTEQTLWVIELLGSLPMDQRTVMALTIDKLTCTEIAQVMDLTPQQVLDLRKRARKALIPVLAVTGGKEDAR